MRGIWWALLLLLLLLACDLHVPWLDTDPWQAELNELAVATFITERTERALPTGPLALRAGHIYSGEPVAGPGGLWVWQVRYPRAEAIRLPLTTRERQAGIEVSADTVVRFDQRYCTLPERDEGRLRCPAWQDTTCCNLLWKRSRGVWLAERP